MAETGRYSFRARPTLRSSRSGSSAQASLATSEDSLKRRRQATTISGDKRKRQRQPSTENTSEREPFNHSSPPTVPNRRRISASLPPPRAVRVRARLSRSPSDTQYVVRSAPVEAEIPGLPLLSRPNASEKSAAANQKSASLSEPILSPATQLLELRVQLLLDVAWLLEQGNVKPTAEIVVDPICRDTTCEDAGNDIETENMETRSEIEEETSEEFECLNTRAADPRADKVGHTQEPATIHDGNVGCVMRQTGLETPISPQENCSVRIQYPQGHASTSDSLKAVESLRTNLRVFQPQIPLIAVTPPEEPAHRANIVAVSTSTCSQPNEVQSLDMVEHMPGLFQGSYRPTYSGV
jgi:hypothetical protein